MRSNVLCYSLLFLLAFVLSGYAQPPGGAPPLGPRGFGSQRPPGQGPRLDPLATLLDHDNNGELSAEEILRIGEILKELDRNNDGKVDALELPQMGPPRGPGGRGGRGRVEVKLVDQFDADKDGRLNEVERKKAREFQTQNGSETRRPRGPGGFGGRARSGVEARPGPKVKKDSVKHFPDGSLYDATVLRTLFLEFSNDDWEQELATFYRTDVMVPAQLTVDGKTYESIGVSFRGNSSFFGVGEGQKRSFNLTIDDAEKQNLYGYRTLNLLNAHSDPSFLREVIYNHIARQYVPAPKANFVRLVINGESWGIYANLQQFNKEFTDEWFGSRGGVRWKVPAGRDSAMVYNGTETSSYTSYEQKSKPNDAALEDLIEVCRLLNDIPIDELDRQLDLTLNLDRVLWFLALDNVLLDMDGYHSRGSDYLIYQDSQFGRFHVLPYDGNETFRSAGGGRGGPGGGRGRGGFLGGGRPGAGRGGSGDPGGGRVTEPTDRYGLSAFAGEDNESLPMIHRLLANPRLRARYVAHVRTITEEWLDWDSIGPVIGQYHELIRDEVFADTRKLHSTREFEDSIEQEGTGGRAAPGLRPFVLGRRKFLLNEAELWKPHADIHSLSHELIVENSNRVVRVQATVTGDVPIAEVLLYYSRKSNAPFIVVAMFDDGAHHDGEPGDGTYGASIPTQPIGSQVSYYVEARSKRELGTTVFSPASTEVGAICVPIELTVARNSAIVISEVMPSNQTTMKDPQGDFDDWVELHNSSDAQISLSGMFLTDTLKDPRKWRFPAGVVLGPGEYLIVWADDDSAATSGLHASFKLAKDGETVHLIDRDENGNQILDSLEWMNLRTDVSFGRGASGTPIPLEPTPKRRNR